MHSKLLAQNDGLKTFAVILQSGDEVKDSLLRFAGEEHVKAASFTAIGALERATLGYYDIQRRDYLQIVINEQVELLSCIGDLSLTNEGEIQLHAHLALGRFDGTTRGGHLIAAHVRPTFEATLTESPSYLRRKYDPASGLALIDLSLGPAP